jgi:hypothetical protein
MNPDSWSSNEIPLVGKGLWLAGFRKRAGRPRSQGTNDARRLLPHEICFGVFLVVMATRLVVASGPLDPHAIAWFAGITINAWLIMRCWRAPTSLNWRLRLWFYPVAMNAYFFVLGPAMAKLTSTSADRALQQVDAFFLGTNLSVRLQPCVHPVLTEFFSLCYFLFFPFLAFSLIYYFVGELALLRRFCVGLFTIYGLGFLGYTIWPAQGPWVAMASQFDTPLTGWTITRLNDAVVRAGSNGVDVFPSLHCAVSAFLLFFDRWYRRWRFRVYLVPCVGLWISTIYLRYHYVIDCVCGFALAALALWLVRPQRSVTPSPAPVAIPPLERSVTGQNRALEGNDLRRT